MEGYILNKVPWKSMRLFFGSLIWIYMINVGVADQHLDNEDVVSAIEAVNKKLADCTNSGDVECAAMFYTENAIYMAPNLEPLKGRENIKAGMVDDGTTVLELNADEIEVFGDTATELGTYVIETRDGGHVDHGNYVVIWKKTNDGWKLHWDIFNTNMP